ncbi:persulfide dioxygenase ETHE1, mitochondrial-like [Tetranychus urticae]|uniref:persulfide dioxygenase ETHE1, mitochondrial-like n=1 Tax=Tetranychus urticae TaxID=32264 RepID=UPI000D6536DD|nr:persulfide dioxygenase ETHE1, mitochondrial-like [Tetranychus urticae]
MNARGGTIFRQLFDRSCCCFTYLIGDKYQKTALLIDPVLEQVDRDLKLVKELGLELKYVLNTHVHADHITGSGLIKDRLNTNGKLQVLSIVSESSGAEADICVDDGEVIDCGLVKLNVTYTPGHTNGCMSLIDHYNKRVFTGDALFIRGCGRTDFQEGSPSKLYDSVHSRLFTLPDDYSVYPAHDYNGHTMSTIGEEKKFNPRMVTSKEEFIEIMENLNLDYPKMLDEAVPKNMRCGS